MRLSRKRHLLAGADDKTLAVAMLFVLLALFSSLAQADVKSVEGLAFSRVQLDMTLSHTKLVRASWTSA